MTSEALGMARRYWPAAAAAARIPPVLSPAAAREVPLGQVQGRGDDVAGPELAVGEAGLAADAQHPPPFERLAERLREAQVPDRGDDLAAFDEERAVAGQPGDDLGLGIEDAAVVELGHQQAPRDGAHHPVDVGRTGADEQVAGKGAEALAAGDGMA